MAQSFSRKIKRGILIPVWNDTFKTFDFFRKVKKSGRYLLTQHPFGNIAVNSHPGPGHHYNTIRKWKKEGALSVANKANKA